jgi:hydroxylamine reductase
MFCFQCEQTVNGGCEKVGNCGKDDRTAAVQDLLLHIAKGVSMYAHRARALGAVSPEVDQAVIEALFTTVTNVSFDADRVAAEVRALAATRERARALYEQAGGKETLDGPAALAVAETTDGMVKQGAEINLRARLTRRGRDLTGLEELLVYGIKGAAAYAHHAERLGKGDAKVAAFFHEGLDLVTRDAALEDLLGACMRCGEVNLRTMQLLDEAHTTRFGHPTPTPVRVTPRQGKAILVSGHDLGDLEELLRQTAGTGINVYTHGEMLPAHGYPGLKKHAHLAGNYGGAWQDQAREFDAFPGAILMTTNCIQRPRTAYQGRIFTTGLVTYPGVAHVKNGDFAPVIAAALAAPGFAADGEDKTILVGFGHQAVLGVADKVVAAVKAGAIRHFFLVGGCDGAKTGRNYYTELVEKIPRDCVVLTLACGKYRFNDMDLGDIGGIPRLLDMGQCNDAYSAIQVAAALAGAFGTDVNGLPLSLVLSWYEQKAVAILLTLLNLGIKNIRIGPSLPAFLSPALVGVLVDKFGLKPITTAEQDLKAILG